MSKKLFLGAIVGSVACGGKILDLGRDQPDAFSPDPGGNAGRGVPALVVTRQHNPVALAIDDARVYWSTGAVDSIPALEDPDESHVVRSCAKENCPATLITYAKSQYTRTIVVDRTHVYWGNSEGVILTCPIDGCSGPPMFVTSNVTQRALAVDESFIYWYSSDGRALQRCSPVDCEATTNVVAPVDGVTPLREPDTDSLTVDGTHLYWIELERTTRALGSVMRVTKDGSETPQVIVSGVHQPRSLAVGPTHVAWTEHSTIGAIKSCPLSGCSGDPTVIASQQSYPYLLTSTDNRFYWFGSAEGWPWFSADHPSGDLFACARTGCGASPERLTTELDWPHSIAADTTYVYWTDAGPKKNGQDGTYMDGAVKRMMWPLR